MTHYFIKDGINEIGPLTIEQLKCRPVLKGTPIWFAGLQEWTTIGQVYELKELFITKRPGHQFSGSLFAKFWNNLLKKNYSKNLPRYNV
ncbi:MAG: DUF4339 domain-containing protein [Chitinophagaceae bacterium]